MPHNENPKFTPANMPQFRPDLAGQVFEAHPEVSPDETSMDLSDGPAEPQATQQEHHVPQRPKLSTRQEKALIKSIRQALGGGNPDVIGRKPKNGRSYRYI